MMEISKLNAVPRPTSGKGPSNRLRRAGQIPAIAYGRDLPATSIAVSPKDLLQVLNSAYGQNAVVELNVSDREKLTVMVRAYAYHPITRDLLHVDFHQVKLDQPVDVDVPFRCTGKPKGVVVGGILQQVFRRLPIRCLPELIPVFIEADVSDLDMGDSLKSSQVVVPPGVKLRLAEDQTVAVVAAPEKGGEEEAKPAAGAPGAPGAPVAGAAPAAGAPAAAGAAAPAAAGAAAKPAAAAAAKPAKPAKGGKGDKKK
jgi:large subunit ribosomal protein L25